ncbi:HUWE1-associated protein modifying stress responses 1-like [Physella acuta]|uniref:HUWE1-associated protein modifying stress responses 1-like n=1 Tax=Physella acuta TaxID=109671 RepID=UPI0027DB123F|nr:HUWE1-associated protein modifying stress responses 1-like [Physella acuta]
MSQDDGQESDKSPDHWFSNFEDECLDELENQGRVEPRLQSAEEHTAQQLWLGFQHTSTAIAQLYNFKDAAHDGYVLLVPFNKAAESLTKFYKDSLNNARECLRLGVQSGRSSRARDIAAWARKKRKCIHRDELLAYLCGKTLPSHSNHHRNRQNRSIERQLPRRPSHQSDTIDSGEYQVMEAYTLQGLNGAMSNINMGYSRPSTTTSCTVSSYSRPAAVEDILFHDERARSSEHRKRTSSSSAMDVNMESPSRKRGKFL